MNDLLILIVFKKQGHWYTGLEYGNNTELNPFSYGATLENWFEYQFDSISANTNLDKDHFENFHKYRVEWEPPEDDGSGGYINWYLDSRFLFSVQSKVLGLAGEISSEPMYLIMNTALGKHWGFPEKCPEGCDCSCYECGNPDCTCGLPEGFCENFPASFEIDHVRVFQAVNESKHVLGCSPEKKPTARFIHGHKKNYISEIDGQKEPLLPVRRGGTNCKNGSDCGGNGECSSNKCKCHDGFTGPRCLSPDGFDDNTPTPEKFEFSPLMIPPSMILFFSLSAMAFIIFLGMTMSKGKEKVIDHYDQLVMRTSYDTEISRLEVVDTTRKEDQADQADQAPPIGLYEQGLRPNPEGGPHYDLWED